MFVPDYRAEAADGGHRTLLDSYRFVTEDVPDNGGLPELWGSSYGAACALAFTFVEVPHLRAVVALGGRYARDAPFSAEDVIDLVRPVDHEVHLVHGAHDSINAPRESEAMPAALLTHRIPRACRDSEHDHAGVVMARYREDLSLGVPWTDPMGEHPMVPVLNRLTE